MPIPIGFGSDGKDIFLNGRGKVEQIHDLAQAGFGNVEPSCGLREVLGPALTDDLLDLVGKQKAFA